MYTTAYHAFLDIEKMYGHIAEHPLGTWVCNAHGQRIANYIPFVLDALAGSIAKTNCELLTEKILADRWVCSIVRFQRWRTVSEGPRTNWKSFERFGISSNVSWRVERDSKTQYCFPI